MNLITSAIKIPIYLYKVCISPYTTSSCRFVPSCSTYAIDALNKLPLRIAIIRVLSRIMKCNPWNKSEPLDKI